LSRDKGVEVFFFFFNFSVYIHEPPVSMVNETSYRKVVETLALHCLYPILSIIPWKYVKEIEIIVNQKAQSQEQHGVVYTLNAELDVAWKGLI
jgi:hypothetical protein